MRIHLLSLLLLPVVACGDAAESDTGDASVDANTADAADGDGATDAHGGDVAEDIADDDANVDADVPSDIAEDADSDVSADTAPDAAEDPAVDAQPIPLVPWEGEVLPLSSFLCDEATDSAAAPDKVYISCAVEGANFIADDDPVRDDETLIVAAYNFERGRRLDQQVTLLSSGEHMPVPDVILGSELDRGCNRSGARNTPYEIAEALGMQYAYAVEFVELEEPDGAAECEHGNALFSRYPLHNVTAIRHAANVSWYDGSVPGTGGGEPRLGGRIAISADIVVDGEPLRLVVVHFESHPVNGDVRDAQAVEMAELGLSVPHRAIVGGDMNAPVYWIEVQRNVTEDPTVHAFLDRGYIDAHATIPGNERATAGSGFVIDLIVGTPGVTFADAAVCPGELCDDYSDHRPVWATVVPE